MKKVLTHFLLIITFLVIYFLQTNFFNWFNIAGIKPNLYILYILFIGLFAGRTIGTTYGIILGIIIDCLSGQNIGITSIMLAAVGFSGGYLDKNFSKENRITIMIMEIGITCLYELLTYIINSGILNYELEMLEFSRILLIEILFNTLITIIVYPIMQRAGYTIEEIFKNTTAKLLTRYF